MLERISNGGVAVKVIEGEIGGVPLIVVDGDLDQSSKQAVRDAMMDVSAGLSVTQSPFRLDRLHVLGQRGDRRPPVCSGASSARGMAGPHRGLGCHGPGPDLHGLPRKRDGALLLLHERRGRYSCPREEAGLGVAPTQANAAGWGCRPENEDQSSESELRRMKIGVTGASGQLGRLVVQQLLGKCPATDVVAIVRDPAKAADLAAAGVETRVADYDDRASLDAAAAGLADCCSSRRARWAGVSRNMQT